MDESPYSHAQDYANPKTSEAIAFVMLNDSLLIFPSYKWKVPEK